MVAAVVVGGYYYSKQNSASTPTPAPAQPGAPAAPGVQGQQVTPVQQQSFSGHWQAIYGNVEVTNGSWTNRSSVTIQSAILQCDQYSANGADLSQARMTLNGPVQPGGTTTFNPFQMGAVNVYMTRVNCAIVAVTPAS
jgi:hypothetical protein